MRRVDLEEDPNKQSDRGSSIRIGEEIVWDKMVKERGGVGSFESGQWNLYGFTPCWVLHHTKGGTCKIAMIMPGLGIMKEEERGLAGQSDRALMETLWTAMNIDLHWIIPTMVHCVYNYTDKKALDRLPPSAQEIVRKAQAEMFQKYKKWCVERLDPRAYAFTLIEKAIAQRIKEEDYGY